VSGKGFDMTKTEFLSSLDEILQQPRGTLKEDAPLDSLSQWDSIAVMAYIALVAETTEKPVSGKQIMACKTAGDLVTLAGIS
jgi:acyl carrier protein